MKTSKQKMNYANPRMDFEEQRICADKGVVKFDPVKGLWVGSMILLGTVGSALTFSWSALILFILFTAFTLCFGHSLGMHRRFIHRAFQCPRWLELFMVHLGTLVGIAGPLGMLKTHDLRDWAQRQRVCHDYFAHKSVWYRDFYWQVFGTIELDRTPEIRIEAEIAQDSFIQWMERHWIAQQLPWTIVFFLLGGWSWVCWGIASRVVVSVFGHWLIGYFAHNHGHRDWHVSGAAVQGHNIPFTALLTMGECWHNNHHAFPYSAKLGLKDKQWDPGWWALKVMEKLGLVWALVLPSQVHQRTDLIQLPLRKERIV